MSQENLVNPHYQSIKARSDAYVARILKLDPKTARKASAADFAFLTASWIPKATEEAVYVLQIWQEWIFLFDDQFDEGRFCKDPYGAAEEIIHTLAVFDETHPVITAEENPLRHLIQLVWTEFKKTASKDHQFRFKLATKKYMIGLLKQVQSNCQPRGHDSDIDSYIQYRRDTIGAEAPYVIMEWAYGLTLPSYVIAHPGVVACCQAGIDITFLDNDILSLQKDLEYDVQHNAITRLCMRGLTVQEAVDQVGDMLDERYETWHVAQKTLPSWGPEIDRQVATLLELYVRLPLGTLHWR
ncbi:hypothetical protein KJ359_000924 [Pestalotiopsis sp. 9143b]|nr:hypothetical protein KJ359_000924 [Pestalotiopsis sp. 9143b]